MRRYFGRGRAAVEEGRVYFSPQSPRDAEGEVYTRLINGSNVANLVFASIEEKFCAGMAEKTETTVRSGSIRGRQECLPGNLLGIRRRNG